MFQGTSLGVILVMIGDVWVSHGLKEPKKYVFGLYPSDLCPQIIQKFSTPTYIYIYLYIYIYICRG